MPLILYRYKIVLGWFVLATNLTLMSGQATRTVWVSGVNEYPGAPGYGNFLIRFGSNGPETEQADLKMNFESTTSAMSDSLGVMLFYTNGCYVANILGDTMPGGDGLNPGEIADWVCSENGYISPKGAMTLPLPGSDHLYYLFHTGARYNVEKKITCGPFYYTVIDMSMNGGLGGVSSKNHILLNSELEPFCAVRHGNGRDWWIIIPEYASNRYYRFLLSPDGILTLPAQEIGPDLACHRTGSSVFSLNGTRYGRTQNCRTVVFDFDRCTGTFSNPLVFDTSPHTFGGGGIAFSPDGSKVLINSQLVILEANLQAATPKLDTVIFTYEYFKWGLSLNLMQYGPDGNLYLDNMSRSNFLNIIRFQDSSATDWQFEEKGLPLPVYNVRTLPNIPNFNLFDFAGSPCDTLGINTPVSLTEKPAKAGINLLINPNPTHGKTVITASEAVDGQWVISGITGSIKQTGIWTGKIRETDTTGWAPGLYCFSLTLPDGRTLMKPFVVL
ncbi:MAG: hypothetical protein L6Q97_17555 [Thermoanaerobaculia bacterium]|nr:hypothetical protein [Thermoanaerobaculia bacterium]